VVYGEGSSHGAERDAHPVEGYGRAGPIMINGPDGRTADFITDQKFGDVELYLNS
jgi:hypothetical protein